MQIRLANYFILLLGAATSIDSLILILIMLIVLVYAVFRVVFYFLPLTRSNYVEPMGVTAKGKQSVNLAA